MASTPSGRAPPRSPRHIAVAGPTNTAACSTNSSSPAGWHIPAPTPADDRPEPPRQRRRRRVRGHRPTSAQPGSGRWFRRGPAGDPPRPTPHRDMPVITKRTRPIDRVQHCDRLSLQPATALFEVPQHRLGLAAGQRAHSSTSTTEPNMSPYLSSNMSIEDLVKSWPIATTFGAQATAGTQPEDPGRPESFQHVPRAAQPVQPTERTSSPWKRMSAAPAVAESRLRAPVEFVERRRQRVPQFGRLPRLDL